MCWHVNYEDNSKMQQKYKKTSTQMLYQTCLRIDLLSRVSTLTRDIDIGILSVCLSLHDVPVLDENG